MGIGKKQNRKWVVMVTVKLTQCNRVHCKQSIQNNNQLFVILRSTPGVVSSYFII